MPLSPAFYQEALSHLSKARPIRARKMFGGAGIYCQEVFFAILDDDRIYFKVDEATRKAYEDLGMGPWMMGSDAQTNYREVPPSIWGDLDVLGAWVDESVEAAKRLKSKKSG